MRINTHLGSRRRNRLSFRDDAEQLRYLGAAPHPAPDPPASHASASAGYHSDLSVPGYQPQTPTVAPEPSQAAQGPAGHYAGARRAYTRSLAALPNPIAALSPPLATASARPSLLSSLSPALAALLAPVTDALRPATPPSLTPPLEQKTLGDPTAQQILQANQKGTLEVNKAGKLTIPSTRSAAQDLTAAKAEYQAKAIPHVTGLLNDEQERFAISLSKHSRIPLKLAAEWTLQESGASSAGAGGEAGEQNQLGVGYPAHPTSFSQSPYFNNTTPEAAGKATAEWMEGKIGANYDYQAAPSIEGIPRLAKSGASEDEIRAYIEGPSAWGTGAIAQSGVTVSGGNAPPGVTRRLHTATTAAKDLGIPVRAATPEQQHVNYLKVFGHQVARQLHYVKSGQLDKGPGTIVRQMTSTGAPADISYGHEPEIAARLKMLAARRGEPIYIISGHRTPQHSVEVGGFADDPHTTGTAADIGVGEPTLASAGKISEAEYESVGLHRPYASSPAEINHVELLNGGTPATGGRGEAPGGASAAGIGVGGAAPAEAAGAGGAGGAAPTSRPSPAALTPITAPLGAGPVTPADVAAGADEHVESAAENLIALLGEGGLGGRRPAL